MQRPTLVTLAMCPVLVVMYVLLSRREERDAEAEFGAGYRRYAVAQFCHSGTAVRHDSGDNPGGDLLREWPTYTGIL